MKPGDLRIVPKPSAWGECYCCRKIYALSDLRPVDSAIENDWRYICKFCLTVAKRPRKTKGEARCALAAERIELSADEQKRLEDLYGQFAPFWFSSEDRRARTVQYVCESELKRIEKMLGWFDELNDFLSECDDKNDPRYAVVKEAKKNFLAACAELYDAL